MTTYTKRDLRAADMLALILFAVGLVLAAVAVFRLAGKSSSPPPVLWIMAVVCLALGTALNLKVRQLVRNKGEEPKDYDGVPE